MFDAKKAKELSKFEHYQMGAWGPLDLAPGRWIFSY
jgi:hypothetical protein